MTQQTIIGLCTFHGRLCTAPYRYKPYYLSEWFDE